MEGKYELYLDGRQKTSIGANESEEVYINADALRLPISEDDTQVITYNGQIRFNSQRQKFQIYLNQWLDLATTADVQEITTEDLGLGWARYDDTVYTSTNKLILQDGVEVTLPNNAGNIIDTHLHSSIQYYNGTTQKVQAEHNADVYIMTIVFKYSAINANQTHIDLHFQGGNGTPYDRIKGEAIFTKGNDVTHDFHQVFQYYTDNDFVSTGATWRITSIGGESKIWDIIYFIQRTQSHQLI